MARLNWAGWTTVVGSAILITLLVLPSTRWVPRLHLSIASGKVRESGSVFVKGNVYSIESMLAPAISGKPRNVEESLLKALLIQDAERRLVTLSQISDEHPADPIVQAILCRYASQNSFRRPETAMERELFPLAEKMYRDSLKGVPAQKDVPKDGSTSKIVTNYELTVRMWARELPKKLHASQLVLKGAERGERCDAQNAFFTIIKADCLYEIGKNDQARAALVGATLKSGYNEYASAIRDMVARPLEGSFFRGYLPLFQVSSFVPFPNDLQKLQLAKGLICVGSEREKVLTRMAILRVMDNIFGKSDWSVGDSINATCAKAAVDPETAPYDPFSQRGRKEHTTREYLQWASQLQARAKSMHLDIPGFDPVKSIRKHLSYQRALKEHYPPLPKENPRSPYNDMERNAGLLIGFLILVPVAVFFAVGQIWRQHEGSSLALRLLPVAWVLATYFHDSKDIWLILMAILLAIGFVISWIPQLQPWVVWVVASAVVLGLLGSLPFLRGTMDHASHAWIVSLVVIGLWGVSSLKGPIWVSWPLAAIQIVGITWFAARLYLFNQHAGRNTSYYLIMEFALLLLVMSFGPRQRVSVWGIVGPVLVVGAIAYGACVRQLVVADRVFLGYDRSYRNEVKVVRELAKHVTLDSE